MNPGLLHLPSAQAKETDGKVETCPLCGLSFAAGEAACGGCAMMRGCSMLKCPRCHYEFVTESKIFNWLKKMAGWFGKKREAKYAGNGKQ